MRFLQPVNTSDAVKMHLLGSAPGPTERHTAFAAPQQSGIRNLGTHSHTLSDSLTSDKQKVLQQALQSSLESVPDSDGTEPSCKKVRFGAGPMDKFLSKHKP